MRGTGKLDVFTFKEGLLSRVAHDLKFELAKFSASLEGDQVKADIPLESLRLVGPVEDGVAHPERYDAGKRGDVEKAMQQDVLHLTQHSVAHFTGRAVAQ